MSALGSPVNHGGRPLQVANLTLIAFLVILVMAAASVSAREAVVVSIEPDDLVEYEAETEPVRKLIEVALDLTKEKLAYRFGSNSPEKGGMDCSGTIQCALMRFGFNEVPRSSSDFHAWASASGRLVPTPEVTSTDDPVFEGLRPGDLLFWEGTYETGDSDRPVSHVMIYLGTLKEDGKGVVFGASSGRRFRGKTLHGVSVFDWEVPREKSESRFVGYGPVPGLSPAKEKSVDPAPLKGNVVKSLLDLLFKKSEVSRP